VPYDDCTYTIDAQVTSANETKKPTMLIFEPTFVQRGKTCGIF
jgi:hypothetical protein